TCVLDILRHLPRCAFSKKQNTVIHWALLALGLTDIPSEHTVGRIATALQKIYGISSIRYKGAFGHVYYVNDLAAIIAQACMANPRVRPYLHFIPEDAGPRLAEAWQAKRWLEELDQNLATPMCRKGHQDFYIHEPALLDDGRVCMPFRWFTRMGKTFARAWAMAPVEGNSGWIVSRHIEFDVSVDRFLVNFASLSGTYTPYGVPDPRCIIGVQHAAGDGIAAWTLTDPRVGNRWRLLAEGHRVVAFPIWLYCDDTSGNLSKKWNKHNSFLFTPAGLPRRLVHQEYNIHFLATSNTASPLEMLDGIVDQLSQCQQSGIWAWDCEFREPVLVIPSVLAMLGDNPMQSEIACHVGLMGRLFCRVCWASKGKAASGEGDNDVEGEDAALNSDVGSQTQKRRKTKPETMSEMVSRLQAFMEIGRLRSRDESVSLLKSQFDNAKRVGGQSAVKTDRTRTGLKDTYQGHFIERLFKVTTQRGKTRAEKEADVEKLRESFPPDDLIMSPVWRIKGFDPHSDTPVEILHVVLLGFVKYFWRDTVARLKDAEKATLIARLSSFDTSGLDIPRLSGATLVNYAGSLVGRDFRALVQAAPFVLHGLSVISREYLDVWIALSRLVALVWQPEIDDIANHLANIQGAIDRFLDATCRLTPRWFNKPKFHILLHLPAHIARFGPPMLFATEGFESFNAVIRSFSIHSNHQAPSRDIANGMAHHNRIRHLLSGGFICVPRVHEGRSDEPLDTTTAQIAEDTTISRWLNKMPLSRCKRALWQQIGAVPRQLLTLNCFGERMLGLDNLPLETDAIGSSHVSSAGEVSLTPLMKSYSNHFGQVFVGEFLRRTSHGLRLKHRRNGFLSTLDSHNVAFALSTPFYYPMEIGALSSTIRGYCGKVWHHSWKLGGSSRYFKSLTRPLSGRARLMVSSCSLPRSLVCIRSTTCRDLT
ncbi:hypothetical protein PYCCODRAFT_1358054, partial [Trametes coccinea BRFM310]